jgi:hypothetical protein
VLAREQFDAIRLQEEELLSWQLVHRKDLGRYLLGTIGLRVRAALEVLDSGAGTVELEDGEPATG